jgi:hypothetical protein
VGAGGADAVDKIIAKLALGARRSGLEEVLRAVGIYIAAIECRVADGSCDVQN